MTRAATIISVILHPVFLYFYCLVYFWLTGQPFFHLAPGRAVYVVLLVFTGTVLLPVLFTWLINRDLYLSERSKRLQPLLGALICYGATYYSLHQIPYPDIMRDYLLILMLTQGMLFLLNLRWKISIHTTALGSLVALFGIIWLGIGTLFWPTIAVLMLAGLGGSARLYLGVHTPFEIYTGYALGFLLAAGILVFL